MKLLLITWVFGCICIGELDKFCRWCPTARANNVDEGAVDVELLIASRLGGHEVFDSHQVFAWRCGLGDGEVELQYFCSAKVSHSVD